MSSLRLAIAEFVRAALVLALLLTILGNAMPASAESPGEANWSAATVLSLCGDGLPNADWAHGPCHACRLGQAAILPPPPATAVLVLLESTSVAYAIVDRPVQSWSVVALRRSRAPPTGITTA